MDVRALGHCGCTLEGNTETLASLIASWLLEGGGDFFFTTYCPHDAMHGTSPLQQAHATVD